MNHLWVALVKDFAGRKPGEKIKLETDAEKQALLDAGLAEDCANPETDAVQAALSDLVQTVRKSAQSAVADEIKKLGRKAGNRFATGAASSFPAGGGTTAPAASRFATSGAGRFVAPAVPIDEAEQKMGGFRSPGEFWMKVVQASEPGRPADNRLVKLFEDAEQKAPTGMNTITGSEGGFLIPETISNQIMELVFDSSGLLARTDTESIAGNSITLKAVDETSRATGSRRGGVRGYWLAEAAQFTASQPAFRELNLKPHKVGVLYYATEEELSDAGGFSLQQKLGQYAAEEINWLVSDAIINGNGVGKPLGILNSGCLVTVSKEGGQSANTVLYANMRKMYYRMLPRSVANAVWLVSGEVLEQLAALAFTTGGSSPVMLAGGQFPNTSVAPFGTFFGRPIVVTEHNPALSSLGDVIFADLSMYKTATRGGVHAAMSIHVRFLYEESAFRFSFRVDGQPWLKSAVASAKNASFTQSPFVTLEAR